jgi:hypothetical protein
MKVLIGYSTCQITRQAFENQGHDAYTCDLRASDGPNHLQCDIWEVLTEDWDLAILHPMCTYLTVSAAWALGDGPYHQKVKEGTLVGAERRQAQREALENFQALLDLPYPVCIENPSPSFISTTIRKPDQVIQPWEFGDDASKSTGLWLTKGLPLLQKGTTIEPRLIHKNGKVYKRWANQTDSGQNRLTPSENRWLERSKTYRGIAEAMGEQWGKYLKEQKTND